MNAIAWGMLKIDRGWAPVIQGGSIQEVIWTSKSARLLVNTTRQGF